LEKKRRKKTDGLDRPGSLTHLVRDKL